MKSSGLTWLEVSLMVLCERREWHVSREDILSAAAAVSRSTRRKVCLDGMEGRGFTLEPVSHSLIENLWGDGLPDGYVKKARSAVRGFCRTIPVAESSLGFIRRVTGKRLALVSVAEAEEIDAAYSSMSGEPQIKAVTPGEVSSLSRRWKIPSSVKM
jgi:hypothetical protein